MYSLGNWKIMLSCMNYIHKITTFHCYPTNLTRKMKRKHCSFCKRNWISMNSLWRLIILLLTQYTCALRFIQFQFTFNSFDSTILLHKFKANNKIRLFCSFHTQQFSSINFFFSCSFFNLFFCLDFIRRVNFELCIIFFLLFM